MTQEKAKLLLESFKRWLVTLHNPIDVMAANAYKGDHNSYYRCDTSRETCLQFMAFIAGYEARDKEGGSKHE